MEGFSDTACLRAARSNNSITVCGLVLWPLTMEHYEDWRAARSVLLLRLAALPASYAVKPYLDAVLSMEADGAARGIVRRLFELVRLSMRQDEGFLSRIGFSADQSTGALRYVSIGDVKIGVQEFHLVRKAIALLNGEELPDESANPELVEAQSDYDQLNGGVPLREDFDDLLASVALASGAEEEAVLQWTIRKFALRRAAIDRAKNHLMGVLVTAGGGKWEKGNPYPSWCYDRADRGMSVLKPEEELLKRLGGAAQIQERT